MLSESSSSQQGFMLHLKMPTDPRWTNLAEMRIEDILVDHAYCEQKAATYCISLIIRYPDKQRLVEVLSPVVSEEWEHFRSVLAQLQARGYSLGPSRKDEYVNRLRTYMRQGGRKADRLTDELLLGALIEARSCERFKLLWKHLEDHSLKQFYYDLMVSEAGHYVNFITLAREYQSRELVDQRWEEWLHIEAEVLASLDVRGDRMH